ncbi:MAG TPA: CorA family divalent cation transporter, partial [Candidatus Limnocylindria bacterium]
MAWLDFADPDDDDLALLRDRLGLHELALEDLRKRRQRTKIDTYRQQQIIVAYEIGTRPNQRHPDFSLEELHLILGQGHLVTVHWGASSTVDDVRDRWR